ncbi:hypothetical protein ODZ84_21135 [Chryseobacterium fluminis]|uniref:hypothetical protein n=1 Tax=Chryseobacterium fluminis TaxID=2983606 RepID=UPI0022500A4D|nr:hypothetical protein [Chryseobacterium sp. MMS21-Ot14]UZT97649.1 hypothetical protein ODZ84_21135 [Chryseobacterium sp. MMS21-Ot14]
MENYRKYLEEIFSKQIIKQLVKFVSIDNFKFIQSKRNSFYNGECIGKKYSGILNIGSGMADIDDVKLDEVERLCMIFKEEHFFFISDWIKQYDLEGITLCFDAEISWEELSGNLKNFEHFFSSTPVPGNWWVSKNWCRYMSGAMSDSYSPYYKKVFDIPHELIVTERSDFERIEKIYSAKYGKIYPILDFQVFFDAIFEDEFKYLLTDNIYITQSSIEYIKNQL